MNQYIVDAFTETVFGGNPAAVCLLENSLSDQLMQAIAKENNLSETAFVCKKGNHQQLRWFTPGGEIDLCGHATLASAYVLFRFVETEAERISFSTLSGELVVEKKGDLLQMTFPAYELKQVEVTDLMEEVLGTRPVEGYIGRYLLCVLENAEQVKTFTPDAVKAKELDGLLLHTTAAGRNEYDCVSRSFGPKLDIYEDPVCGSGYCHIIPFWFQRLGKSNLLAYQASDRGGKLYCQDLGDKIILAGKTVLFSQGEIYPDQSRIVSLFHTILQEKAFKQQ